MATASTVTLALVDSPPIYYGFWHSFDTTFPQGPVLTVSNPFYAFITLGTALYTAWVISRAWRILDFLIFKSIYKRTKTSLEESQCAAILVNSVAPLDAVVTAGQLLRRGGPKNTLTKIILSALLLVSLKAAIPVIIAFVPSAYKEGLVVSTDCGYLAKSNSSADWTYAVKLKRLGNAGLFSTDQNRTQLQSTNDRKAATLAPLPEPSQSYVLSCPTGATCHPDHPFNFTSVYTLTSRHFGLNIAIPFSLQVSDTCYRPIQAIAHIDNTSNPTAYGLYYGPNNLSASNIYYDYTGVVFAEQRYAPGYGLRSLSSLTYGINNVWMPNSTLLLGGDTTILFYFIGLVEQTQQNNDPIFATSNVTASTIFGTFYLTDYVVSPVVCDTKYQLCAGDGRDCSPNGPASRVIEWMDTTKKGHVWDDIHILFSGSTLLPPIMLASLGSEAVAASQTLLQTEIQSDPGYNSAFRELGRLSQAGMNLLASGTQLAALGYWNSGQGSQLTPKYQLCHNVVIQSNSAVSILITPYLIFLLVTSIIVGISYLDLLGTGKWGEYADLWALYSVGQLHRQIAEQHYGKVSDTKPSYKWPNLRSKSVGFDVVERYGSKFFAPATPVSAQPDDWVEKFSSVPILQYPFPDAARPDWSIDSESNSFVAMHISDDNSGGGGIASTSSPGMSIRSASYVQVPSQTLDSASRRNSGHFGISSNPMTRSPENTASPTGEQGSLTSKAVQSSPLSHYGELSFHYDTYDPYADDSHH